MLATNKGSVLDMHGWAKAYKQINLIRQETATDENGRGSMCTTGRASVRKSVGHEGYPVAALTFAICLPWCSVCSGT